MDNRTKIMDNRTKIKDKKTKDKKTKDKRRLNHIGTQGHIENTMCLCGLFILKRRDFWGCAKKSPLGDLGVAGRKGAYSAPITN